MWRKRQQTCRAAVQRPGGRKHGTIERRCRRHAARERGNRYWRQARGGTRSQLRPACIAACRQAITAGMASPGQRPNSPATKGGKPLDWTTAATETPRLRRPIPVLRGAVLRPDAPQGRHHGRGKVAAMYTRRSEARDSRPADSTVDGEARSDERDTGDGQITAPVRNRAWACRRLAAL